MLTVERLKYRLTYEPSSGIFRWNNAPSGRKSGEIAGSRHRKGYCQIMIDGKPYLAHRLAWLYVHGRWPKDQIDHKNGVKDFNPITNLREVGNRANQQNQVRHRNGRLPGASFHKSVGRWIARYRTDGKLHHLGYFDTEQEAHEAYLSALEEHDAAQQNQ
jgi:hypothetical protein